MEMNGLLISDINNIGYIHADKIIDVYSNSIFKDDKEIILHIINSIKPKLDKLYEVFPPNIKKNKEIIFKIIKAIKEFNTDDAKNYILKLYKKLDAEHKNDENIIFEIIDFIKTKLKNFYTSKNKLNIVFEMLKNVRVNSCMRIIKLVKENIFPEDKIKIDLYTKLDPYKQAFKMVVSHFLLKLILEAISLTTSYVEYLLVFLDLRYSTCLVRLSVCFFDETLAYRKFFFVYSLI
jgi:hypothetical protein